MADRVTFTKPAAERIGKVVRIVEAGDREAAPYAVDVRLGGDSQQVRLCSWTSTWAIQTTSQITIFSTGSTATAYNRFFGVRPGNGVVVRDGGTWHLVSVKLTDQPGYSEAVSESSAGVLGVEVVTQPIPGEASGATEEIPVLKWYSFATCSTT